MRKLLSEKRSMKFSIQGGEFEDYGKTMNEILDWVPKDNMSPNEQYNIARLTLKDTTKGIRGRAAVSNALGSYDSSLNLLTMNVPDQVTFAHEFGHHLSYNVHDFIKDQNRFFYARTKGEVNRKLRTGIFGRKDKFENYDEYAGRVYSDGRSPEVSSIGIQKIWENPYEAAKRDPEWFNMIIKNLKKLES